MGKWGADHSDERRNALSAMVLLAWSTGALITGFILDALFGDPRGFPHIVRWMGSLIAGLEKALRKLLSATPRGEKAGGVLLVIIMALVCAGLPLIALVCCYVYLPPLSFVLESLLCWQLIAAKSLKSESMRVFHSLRANDIEGARYNLSMIVGRDTASLSDDGIIRAAVETVAENASDGVAAPLLYMMPGGAVLGCLYKAVNTMDSMVGYKNDRYINFGRSAAKTDDVLNFLPSRICALLMILSAYILRFDGKSAYRVWKRDRRKHASPNSAQTEAVCAGALGIRLSGPASYHGSTTHKPYIGDDIRAVRADDINEANKLMYAASVLTLIIAVLFRAALMGMIIYGVL
jgi:adenosylcobinamide-phosphate synthase